jgi:hypothetical protein
MSTLFRHRFLSSFGFAILSAILLLLFSGQVDLRILFLVFVISIILLSYPSIAERLWQTRTLPPDTLHVPMQQLRRSNEIDLLCIFDLPTIYSAIKNRYRLKSGDANAPGIFLYIYIPSTLYEMRNAGPETIYRHIAERLKKDLDDPQDLDLIAQRNLPLTFGFRFLPKNAYPYHELGTVVSIVKKEYLRENTRIRGVLQSKKRMFRMHLPDDSEWRTFQPYIEDSGLIYGGATLAHDFRFLSNRKVTPAQAHSIEAERVEYPDRVLFGSLLTYAKKGEISLQGKVDVTDKLYIDRINVLVNGSQHRKELLGELSKRLNRELTEEDFYPLFNYGQKLVGYLEPGKSVSDFISSHGNFALYYDPEKGWTISKLEPGLELKLEEAYWGEEPRNVNGAYSLSASRAALISGSADSLLRFQISTGTPTRGQVFAADEIIENKMKSFAQAQGFKLIRPVGTGAEGCLYLAAKNSHYFYLKSPDGNLAQEEIATIEALKKVGLIPSSIHTFSEDRIIVMPEFQSVEATVSPSMIRKLVLEYANNILKAGYLCLDMTPEHVKVDYDRQKLFLIDFSGYAELARFRSNSKELAADRKKIEYITPEESFGDFQDAEKFQVFLTGLLFYQISARDHGLPLALKCIRGGENEYRQQLEKDLAGLPRDEIDLLDSMLAYDPKSRKSLQDLVDNNPILKEDLEKFWKRTHS